MIMAATPGIEVTGAGSRREAARLAQTIGDGVAAALAGEGGRMHIDTLRVRLPASASRAQIERAIRRAIDRHTKADDR